MFLDEFTGKGLIQRFAEFIYAGIMGGDTSELDAAQAQFGVQGSRLEQAWGRDLSDTEVNDAINNSGFFDKAIRGSAKQDEDGNFEFDEGLNVKREDNNWLGGMLGIGNQKDYLRDDEGKVIFTNDQGGVAYASEDAEGNIILTDVNGNSFKNDGTWHSNVARDALGREIKEDEGFGDKIWKGLQDIGTFLVGGKTYKTNAQGQQLIGANGEAIVDGKIENIFERFGNWITGNGDKNSTYFEDQNLEQWGVDKEFVEAIRNSNLSREEQEEVLKKKASWGGEKYSLEDVAKDYEGFETSQQETIDAITAATSMMGESNPEQVAMAENTAQLTALTEESNMLAMETAESTGAYQDIVANEIIPGSSFKSHDQGIHDRLDKIIELLGGHFDKVDTEDVTDDDRSIASTLIPDDIDNKFNSGMTVGALKNGSLPTIEENDKVNSSGFLDSIFSKKKLKSKTQREAKTETTTNENGEKVTTITKPDGLKTVTTTRLDGTSYTVTYDENGDMSVQLNDEMNASDAGQWMSDKTANIFGPVVDTFNAFDYAAEVWNKEQAPWKDYEDVSDWFNEKVNALWETVLGPFNDLKAQVNEMTTDMNNTSVGGGYTDDSAMAAESDFASVDDYSTNEDGQLVDSDGNIVYNDAGVPLTGKDKDNYAGWSDELNKRIGTNSNNDGTKTTVSFRGGASPHYIEKRELTSKPSGKKGPYTETYYYRNGSKTIKYYDINGTLRHTHTENGSGSSDVYYDAGGKKLTNRVGAVSDPLQSYLTSAKNSTKVDERGIPVAYSPTGAPDDMNTLSLGDIINSNADVLESRFNTNGEDSEPEDVEDENDVISFEESFKDKDDLLDIYKNPDSPFAPPERYNDDNNRVGAPDDMSIGPNPLNKAAMMTSGFGPRKETNSYHKGVDIIPKDGSEDANVNSTIGGKVVSVTKNVPDSDTGLNYQGNNAGGNEVIIQAPNGLLVRNSHMKASSIPSNIEVGSTISAGENIGKMGSTGRSGGSHLHYEIGMPDAMGNIIPLNPNSLQTINSKANDNRIGEATQYDSRGIPMAYSPDNKTNSTTTSSSGTSTSSTNSGNAEQFQLWINICQNVKEQFAKYSYNQSGYADFSCNNYTIHARLDCSGYVTACMSCFSHKKFQSATGSMLTQDPSQYGFTKMKFPGWDNLYQGDIIIANGHTEIFYGKVNGSYKSWSVGPNGIKDKGPGSSNKSKYNWTVLWRPNCSNGSTVEAGSIDSSSSGASLSSSSGSSGLSGPLGELINSLTNFGYEFLTGVTGIGFGGGGASSTSTDGSSSGSTYLDESGSANATNKGDFKKYNLSQADMMGVANIVGHEQGTRAGKYAEASLIANMTDPDGPMKGAGSQYATGNVRSTATSGWFAGGKKRINSSERADADAIAEVKDTIMGGKRTLPRYINEHDCWSDIASVSGGGGKNDKAGMKPHTTTIKNKMGSTYKFYTFPGGPSSGNDPFGYTSDEARQRMGDDFYAVGDPGEMDLPTIEPGDRSRMGEPGHFDIDRIGEPEDTSISKPNTEIFNNIINEVKRRNTPKNNTTSISHNSGYKSSSFNTPNTANYNNTNSIESANMYSEYEYDSSTNTYTKGLSNNSNNTSTHRDNKMEALIDIMSAVYNVLCDIDSNTAGTTDAVNTLSEKEFVDKGLRKTLNSYSKATSKKHNYIPPSKGNISKVLSMAIPQ